MQKPNRKAGSRPTWREPQPVRPPILPMDHKPPLLDVGPRARLGLYVLLAVVLFVFVILPGARLLLA